MELTDIATGQDPVPLKKLAADATLAEEVQRRLAVLGCLDPPAGGKFGPVSRLALRLFAQELGLAFGGQISPKLAAALLEQTPKTFRPVRPGDDLAGRIVRYMQAHDQFVAVLPGFLTIVYLEGADPDGVPNSDALDKWNDVRMVLRIGPTGRPTIVFRAVATTEPGLKFTKTPLNSAGAARIALEQFKAWRVGTHKAGTPGAHEALVQRAKIAIFRDKDKDGLRKGDKRFVGSGFGINQHSGHNASKTSIGEMSAGCLVGRTDAKHQAFMKLVKTDARYTANHSYLFMTSVIRAKSLPD